MLVPMNNNIRRNAVFEAMKNVSVMDTDAKMELERLSKHDAKSVEIDPVPEGMYENVKAKTFSVVITCYVLIPKMWTQPAYTEQFPGEAQGHFVNGKAVVDKLTICVDAYFD